MLKFTTKKYLALVICLLVFGCANNPLSSYSSNMTSTITNLQQGNLSQSEAKLTKSNSLLYYLEHGTLMRMSVNYSQSNKDFTNAQRFIDAWIDSFHNGTLGSASDTMEASLINDKVLDYVAKDYEKVMIPTYKSLNFMSLNDIDSSRVEIMRMYNLEDIIQNYRDSQYAKSAEDDKSTPKGFPSYDKFQSDNQNKYDFDAINSPEVLALKNSYQNAFSHYLAGFIFEARGEMSLARPGYVRAGQLNPNNKMISQAIANIDTKNLPDKNSTDLLLVEEVGHAPELKSVQFSIPFTTNRGQTSCINAVTISFPELVLSKENYKNINLSVDGVIEQTTLFTDFNLMAARYLHDNLPNIFLRNIIRAAKDITLQQTSCSAGGSIGSLLAVVGGIVLGSADERTWSLLPSAINVKRMRLKKGPHVIRVTNNGRMHETKVNLTGNYAILSYRVIGSEVYFSN
jgi:hypothetical protein